MPVVIIMAIIIISPFRIPELHSPAPVSVMMLINIIATSHMWLLYRQLKCGVQIEMCSKYEIDTGFQRLTVKKRM